MGVVQAGGHEDRGVVPGDHACRIHRHRGPRGTAHHRVRLGDVRRSDRAGQRRRDVRPRCRVPRALAVANDPSCRLSAANPTLGEVGSLEEIGVDCTLTVAGSGAPIEFRSIVLRPGVTVQRYLDGLAAAPGLQVVGGSLAGDPDGPYLDLSGRLQDGRTYSCRAWGQAPVAADTSAVAIVCGATMADVVDFWRLHKS